MMRYLKFLADKDYALDRGMIPLGSCTMKLNSATEMAAVTWPEFANIHPFAPREDVEGYLELIGQLEGWLAEVTGYDAVSLQPNAGSQGELAGLLAIRAYHLANGDAARTVCLIPSSAHGTNAASAVLAGMRVVVVACDDLGNVDLADLRAKVDEHAADLAALMVTYPSTHGVYEHEIRAVTDAVHAAGGQVYVDGANLNALLGYARFGDFGGDVSHLNLHKTFCIPHGGGGPGVGPVAAKAHLAPFLPGHPLDPRGVDASKPAHQYIVSAAPHGSPGILPISWSYVRMMGADGLRRATGAAVLAANYVAAKLRDHYPVLYKGDNGLVAHECILDLRPLREATGDHRRRRGEAADRLRLPRSDDVVPGSRHAHGRADRERRPRRARPLHRGDDRDPGRGGCRGRGSLAGLRQSAGRGAAHRGVGHRGRVDARLLARGGRLSGAHARARRQVLAAGAPDRPGLRRPQPDLRVSAGGGVRVASRDLLGRRQLVGLGTRRGRGQLGRTRRSVALSGHRRSPMVQELQTA